MKWFLPLLAALMVTVIPSALRADELPVAEFVKVLRTPPGRETWGKLSGLVSHRRRGVEPVVQPIDFNILFTGSSTLAKVVYRKTEICTLSQSYLPPFAATVEQSGEKSTLESVGLRPGDLTMDFLFWNFDGEGEKQTIRGLECRSLLFKSKTTGNKVRVFAAANQAFPVRVEWIDPKAPEGKPFRTLEVNSFKKIGDLWTVEELSVSGPGWKTLIKFSEFNAGYTKDGVPSDLL